MRPQSFASQAWSDERGWISTGIATVDTEREAVSAVVNGGSLIGEYRIIDVIDGSRTPLYVTIERRK